MSELGVRLRSGGGYGSRWQGARESKERVVEGGGGRCRTLRGIVEGSEELWRGSTALGRSAGGRGESGECGCCRLPEAHGFSFRQEQEGKEGKEGKERKGRKEGLAAYVHDGSLPLGTYGELQVLV